MAKKRKKTKKSKKALIITLSIIIAVLAVFFIYVSDYYKADETALSCLAEFEETDYGYETGSGDTGVIIYPGGKVEAKSYLPLAKKIADEGKFVCVSKMPFNLAIFNIGAADAVIDAHSEIESWYVGGHSLGGSMAAMYAEGSDRIDGLFLLAAYSTADLSQKGIEVSAMYGSEDTVMSKLSFDTYLKNLPSDVHLYVIDGGNHAQFGSYGFQEGDSQALITAEEQIKAAADYIVYLTE